MKREQFTSALAVAVLLPLSAGHGEPLELVSPAHRVQLLELYTSEGCSSCPPADRWISTQTDNPGLWNDIVPLAFHVDYWDYLGWQDRFASAAYSKRQRNWARERAVRTVYTPGFLVDGQEWRAWFSNRKLPGSTDRRAGTLNLSINASAVGVSFTPPEPANELTAHVALLGFGLETSVRAGENSGRTLTHDFVVLGVESTSLEKAGSTYGAMLALPETKEPARRHAIAAWVTGPDSQRALQAVGGWLEDVDPD